MADVPWDTEPVTREEHDRLVQRVDALESRLAHLDHGLTKELRPTVEEHDDRLDAVELRVDEQALRFSEMVAEQRRIANELTVTNGSIRQLLTKVTEVLELLRGGK